MQVFDHRVNLSVDSWISGFMKIVNSGHNILYGDVLLLTVYLYVRIYEY